MYITNTVGKELTQLTQHLNSPDGNPYVNTSDNVLSATAWVILIINNNSNCWCGVIPTTSTTPNDPNTGDVKAAYDAANSWAQTEATTMISNEDHSRLLMNYSGDSMYYMYSDQQITPNANYGTSINQEFRWGINTYNYYYMANSSGSNLARYQHQLNNISSPSAAFTGEAIDVGQYLVRSSIYSGGTSNWPATLPNAGFYYVSTPYTFNTYTNFIVTVQQVPDFTALNAATGSAVQAVDRIQIQSREYTVKRHTLVGSTYTYTDGTKYV